MKSFQLDAPRQVFSPSLCLSDYDAPITVAVTSVIPPSLQLQVFCHESYLMPNSEILRLEIW